MATSKYDDLTPANHTDAIVQLQAMENAIKREKLAAIESYDRKEKWKADGVTSMASWLDGMLGQGRDTAHEEVRVSHALGELPKIDDAYRDGLLSWDQLRAVSVFATPATDEQLAGEARKFSAQQLRRMARRFKPVSRDEANDDLRARSFQMWWDVSRSMLRLKGQLPGAEGAVLEKAIDRIYRQLANTAGHSGEGFASREQLQADALVELASTHIAADSDADRATIGVHVDVAVLAGEKGMAELDRGQPICVETAQRLACNARWYVVVDGPDGLPLGIGKASRRIPAWMAREIRHRDGGCRWFGCGRNGWIDIHHLVAWPKGPTDMDNLLMLCRTHHRLVHEGGWKIIGDPNGELTFIAPTGVVYEQGPPALRPELKKRGAALTGARTVADDPPEEHRAADAASLMPMEGTARAP